MADEKPPLCSGSGEHALRSPLTGNHKCPVCGWAFSPEDSMTRYPNHLTPPHYAGEEE